jgi:hypothetical protein
MGRLFGIVRCLFRGCDMRLIASGYDRADRRHQWRCATCGYQQATAVGALTLDADTGRFGG